MTMPSYINPKTAKQIQDLRSKVADATAAREAALAEVQRRTLASDVAARSLAEVDPDDVTTWEKADANARRANQALRQAEQALATVEASLVTHRKALFQALRASLANVVAERLSVLPEFEAAHDALCRASAKVADIAAEQASRRAEACAIAAHIGEASLPLIDTHAHVVAIQDALRNRVTRSASAAVVRVEA